MEICVTDDIANFVYKGCTQGFRTGYSTYVFSNANGQFSVSLTVDNRNADIVCERVVWGSDAFPVLEGDI